MLNFDICNVRVIDCLLGDLYFVEKISSFSSSIIINLNFYVILGIGV